MMGLLAFVKRKVGVGGCYNFEASDHECVNGGFGEIPPVFSSHARVGCRTLLFTLLGAVQLMWC